MTHGATGKDSRRSGRIRGRLPGVGPARCATRSTRARIARLCGAPSSFPRGSSVPFEAGTSGTRPDYDNRASLVSRARAGPVGLAPFTGHRRTLEATSVPKGCSGLRRHRPLSLDAQIGAGTGHAVHATGPVAGAGFHSPDSREWDGRVPAVGGVLVRRTLDPGRWGSWRNPEVIGKGDLGDTGDLQDKGMDRAGLRMPRTKEVGH
jgi:hypothetical protein